MIPQLPEKFVKPETHGIARMRNQNKPKKKSFHRKFREQNALDVGLAVYFTYPETRGWQQGEINGIVGPRIRMS